MIAPGDADGDARNGHQAAVRGEVTVTVTSADGTRTKRYRVRLGPSPECLRGDIAAGFSLVSYEGGSVEALEACARSLQVTALWTLDDGEWVGYIVGAPGFVNEPFRERFPSGLPPITPLVAVVAPPP